MKFNHMFLDIRDSWDKFSFERCHLVLTYNVVDLHRVFLRIAEVEIYLGCTVLLAHGCSVFELVLLLSRRVMSVYLIAPATLVPYQDPTVSKIDIWRQNAGQMASNDAD